jgi:ferredoxin
MIVADRKPLDEILIALEDAQKILVVGCGTCVAVCLSGGQKEAALLAVEIRMALKLKGIDADVTSTEVQRQCETEFVETLQVPMADRTAVVSIGCGAGVQFLAKTFPNIRFIPGLNTRFIGVVTEPGIFSEYCQACGDCLLHLTGGICPISRCSKSLLNGPCGGSAKGHCEISDQVDCGWQLIYDKLKAADRLDLISKIQKPKNWQTARDGGPRTAKREGQKI